MPNRKLLLIAGMPAAGKSTFCEWLATNRGFRHVDIDHPKPSDAVVVQAVLRRVNENDTGPLEALLQRSPIVIDWGFPVEQIELVRAMKSAGFQLAWFDAPEQQARTEYIKRGEGSLEAFEQQALQLAANRKALLSLFDPNVLTTLDAHNARLPPEEIASRLGISRMQKGKE